MVAKVLGSLLLNVITNANTSGLEKTDKAIRKTSNSLKRISKDTGLLGKLSGKIFGGFSIYTAQNLFNSYLQFEKDIGAMRSRFYAITKDERQAGEEFEYIRKLATDTALDIKKTADSYSIFYSATRKALGAEGTRDVFENWTRVSRVLHLTDNQFERVTYALREMASKGAIYSQDLRMQIGTHVPNAMGLAQKAAEEMGFTGVDWFEKLQKAAKGNVSMTAEFVRRFSRQAGLQFGSEEAFRKAMQQPDALAKRISNIGYNFMIDFSKAGGSYMIVKILQSMSDFLTGIDYYAITDNLGRLAKIAGDIFNFLFKHITGVMTILRAILSVLIVSSVFKKIDDITSLWSLTSKKGFSKFALRGLLSGQNGIIAQSIAQGMLKFGGKIGFTRGLLTGLLRFVGGPWGLAISAIITFLPHIISLINKFWGKKEDKKNIFAKYGTNAQSLYDTLLDISQNKGINTTEKFQQALAKTEAGKLLWANAFYDDNSQVTIHIDGTNFNLDDLKTVVQEGVKSGKQDKKQVWMDRFPQPVQSYSKLR